jgi:signal transduction histidine kinase/DNA-binding response OmpR family regulator
VRAGEARTCQNRFRHGNGAYRTLSWTVVPFREDRLIYVTARDVSDRESMESDLRRAHDELESRVAVRTEELRLANEALAHAKDAAEAASRAKSGFLAHMSHEIRTPMNAILGYTQLLERDAELSSKQAAHLAVIHRASDNLLTLINDVLEMAKSEAGQHKLALAPVDVGRVFDDLESLFRLRAQAALLSFEIQRQADLPQRVLADEGKLRQILVNLLGNAVKFTKQGGVLVRLSGREADGRIILVVEVEDTGPGIAPGEMSRLFQPFAQAGAGSRSPGGTGLGLAISREFARLMSGDITVRSQLGKGAIFRLEVPVEPIAYRPRSETPTAPPGGRVVAIVPHGTTPRVLVLDDDAVARRGLADMVAKVGFDVADADLAGALDAVRAGHPPHAILLAASAMDAASMATLRALRALLDETEATASIIALTPSGSATALTAVLEAGADGVLERPYRDADVFQELQRRIGVEYTRAPPVDTRSTLPERFAALLEAKVALDPQTRADLRNAARCADYDRLNGIIDGLRATHAVLAAELARLAERFAYDDIERVLAPDPES